MTTQLGPSHIAHTLKNKGPNNSSSIIAQLLIKCPLSLVISLEKNSRLSDAEAVLF